MKGKISDHDLFYNYLAPMSDQDRISPYNTNPISSRQVRRVKLEISIRGLLVNQISSSQKKHNKNCMTDSKENC